MSIRVVCPNGHTLKVKDDLVGKTGLCPKCKARVVVPAVRQEELSEDAILSILGPHASEPSSKVPARRDFNGFESPASAGDAMNAPPNKSCDCCNREISAALHICPFCHTYIASSRDF